MTISRKALLLLLLLGPCAAFAQGLSIPMLTMPLPPERSRLTTALPVVDAPRLQSMQATRRTTENSLRQVGQLIENLRTQLDALGQNNDEPGSKEKQADLASTLDVAREAEHHFRDSIRLLDERLQLEEEKRQANADRARRLEDDGAAEKSMGEGSAKAFTLEQADQAKAALAAALDREKLVQAQMDSLKAEEEELERQATEAATVLSRREAELGEVREKQAQERRHEGTPDELSHLQKFARIAELRRGQARDRVAQCDERRTLLAEKRQMVEFMLESSRLEVSTLRRQSEFITDRASVSQEDVEARGEKLLVQEQEREKRLAAAEAEARKADSERAAAAERRTAAEEEVVHARKAADRDVARTKAEAAALAVEEAEARKQNAETRMALAQAEFDRERERTSYYGLMRDIRANTVSNTELNERRHEVRNTLTTLGGKLDAAERQVEEGRAARRVMEGQIATLTGRLQVLESSGDKALAPRVREQQRALTRVVEQREEHVALQMSLIATLGDTRRLLQDLERRLDRELGISRIWERKTSALSSEGLKHAEGDLAEIQSGVLAAVAHVQTEAGDLAREAVSLETLSLGVLTLVLAYLDLAFLLWARRRLAEAGEPDPARPRDPRRAAVRVAHRAVPYAGVLGFALLAAGWLPTSVTGILVTVSGCVTAGVAGCAAIAECFAPWAEDKRLAACSHPVARHLHGHLRRIVLMSAVVLPVIHAMPFLFAALSRPAHTGLTDLLWATYKLVMVVEILLLAYPRDLMMSALPEGTSRLAAMAMGALRVLYPVITLFVLSLFALGAVGYVDLARFLWVSTLQTLLAVGAAWGVHALLRFVLNAVFVGEMTLPPDAEPSEERLAAIALVNGTTRLARYVLAVTAMIGLYYIWGGDTEGLQTLNRYGRAQMTFGPFVLSPYAVVQACLTIYVSLLASRYLTRFLEAAVYPTTDFDTGIRYAVSTAVHYFVMALGLSHAMETVGIGMEYVKWFAGAIGLGAGFGLQSIVTNIISGVIVLIERPVKLGDWIEVGGICGRVERISIRSTTVCNDDDIEVIIPNAELVSQKVSNWTHTSTVTRIRTTVRVAYGTDTDVMRRLLLEVARTSSHVLQHPAPQALFRHFGEHALEFELVVALKDPALRIQTSSDMNVAIEKALRKARIAVPDNVSHAWEPGGAAALEMRQPRG